MSPHAQLSPPLGLAYVAAHLRDAGHHVELTDLNVTGFNPERLRYTLGRLGPDLVGISALTETYLNAVRIAALVKEHDPHIPVIIGGPHASILPTDVLAEPWVDFVAVGEGERTAVELAAAVEGAGAAVGVMPTAETLASIRGLGWRRDGEVVLNASRPPLDAAEVGRPARDLLSLEFYHDAHNILTARGGCPYRCPFCSASHLWGGRRRPRPPSQIMAELDEMADVFGAGHVFFVDDIFTLDRRWLDELLGLLEERPAGITWGCATRVDLVSERLLRRMASVGCTAIQFGIESGAQEVLDSVKGIKKPDALNAVRWTVSAGMTATCSFMVPFPEDTESTLAETLEFMREVKDAGGELLISFTTPYPGTRFAEEAEELGLTILTDDWSLFDAKHVVMATRHLSAPRIEALAEDMAHTLGMRRSVV